MSEIKFGKWPGEERTADDLHPVLCIHAIGTRGPHSEVTNELLPFVYTELLQQSVLVYVESSE